MGTQDTTVAPSAASLDDRQCGRCRRLFPGDPDLHFQTEWALCPQCSEILLPARPNRKSVPES